MSLGIILQARAGSTRLPGKMIKEFHEGKSLLQIILKKLQRVGSDQDVEVILATSDNMVDDRLCEIAESIQCKFYRGSESDVLSRFIETAKEFNFNKVIRVCGDNPFLLERELSELVLRLKESKADYLSYKVNGKPSILTHFGFWAEGITLDALDKTSEITSDSFYHEHVTNYVYTHSEEFDIEWIEVENSRLAKNDIRLTIDTEEDFKLTSEMFSILSKNNDDLDLAEIISYIDQNPDLIEKMIREIASNTK